MEVDAVFSTDILKFGAGIAASDIELSREGKDLLLKHRNGQDQVRLIDWFTTTDAYAPADYRQVGQVEFADGTQWNREDLMRPVTGATTLRYLITPSTQREVLDFRGGDAQYVLNGVEHSHQPTGKVEVAGNGTVNTLWAAPGVTLDARQLMGGSDVILLGGTWAEYTKVLDALAGNITLAREVDGKLEIVIVANGSLTVTQDRLVFADGSVRTDTVRKVLANKGATASVDDLKAEGLMTGTTTADDWDASVTSRNPGALLPTEPGGSLQGATMAQGVNFALPSAGDEHLLVGSGGVDQVYITPGARVNARQMLGGEDRIFFTGAWADYSKELDGTGGVIIFTREVSGQTEHVTVANGQVSTSRDLLVFADGAVRNDTARLTLLNKGLAATVGDLKDQGALTSSTLDDWRSDTYSKRGGVTELNNNSVIAA